MTCTAIDRASVAEYRDYQPACHTLEFDQESGDVTEACLAELKTKLTKIGDLSTFKNMLDAVAPGALVFKAWERTNIEPGKLVALDGELRKMRDKTWKWGHEVETLVPDANQNTTSASRRFYCVEGKDVEGAGKIPNVSFGDLEMEEDRESGESMFHVLVKVGPSSQVVKQGAKVLKALKATEGELIVYQPNFQHSSYPPHVDEEGWTDGEKRGGGDGFGKEIYTLQVSGGPTTIFLFDSATGLQVQFPMETGDCYGLRGAARQFVAHGIITSHCPRGTCSGYCRSCRISLNIRVGHHTSVEALRRFKQADERGCSNCQMSGACKANL